MRTPNAVLALLVTLAALAGCHAAPKPKPDDGLAWTQEKLPPPTDGAIYQAGREMVLA
jgi:hypothetical protein